MTRGAQRRRPRRPLAMWVVYASPSDFPGRYVVRRHHVPGGPDGKPFAVVGSLEEARAALPEGLHRLDRHPLDEPQIVEVWL